MDVRLHLLHELVDLQLLRLLHLLVREDLRQNRCLIFSSTMEAMCYILKTPPSVSSPGGGAG